MNSIHELLTKNIATREGFNVREEFTIWLKCFIDFRLIEELTMEFTYVFKSYYGKFLSNSLNKIDLEVSVFQIL